MKTVAAAPSTSTLSDAGRCRFIGGLVCFEYRRFLVGGLFFFSIVHICKSTTEHFPIWVTIILQDSVASEESKGSVGEGPNPMQGNRAFSPEPQQE